MPENCRFVRRLNLVRVTGGHETFLKNYTLGPRAHKFLPASLSLSLPSPPSPSFLPSLRNFSNEGFEKSDRRGRVSTTTRFRRAFSRGDRRLRRRENFFNACIIQGRANEKFEFRRGTLTNVESVSREGIVTK